MKLISTFFAMLIIGITMNISAQNGPILTLGTVTTTGSTAIVPITVDNFINIKSCNLKISYDPAIGTPTGVTKGIGMNGTITLNLNTPGLIKLAWNAVTGGVSTLNDGSVLFNISFNKAGFGTSSLAFDESYDLYDCQFYSASYKALPDIPGTNYYFPGTLTFDSQMSPVTTAPMLTACSGANIDVPVTVSGFKNIGAVSLTLKYNPAVLNFNSGSNTGNFPGLSVGNQVPGTITIGGFSDDPNGYSLANESVLFTLSFTYNGGTSELKWFDDDGYSCQYANPLGESDLNDTPQATYYKNGSIGPCQTTPAPTIAVETISNPITCGGTGTISLTFTNVPNGTYAISYDGGSFSNVSVSGNAASITVPSGIYNNLKITVGGETSATGVNASLVNPTAPEKPTLEVTQPTCAVANGAVAITSPTSGLTFSTDGANYDAYTAPFVVAAGANYSITAKNMSGCVSIAATGTMGTELTAPEKPTLEVTQPTCAVANGAVAITSPTSGLTFSTDGANYAAYTAPFVVAAGANYSITAKNMSGCVSIAATGTMGTELTAPTVVSPSVTPSFVIGSGQVVFSASANTGTIKWFDSASEGLEVSVLNPIITSTTTYYAEAISPEGCISASRTAVTATVIPQGNEELSYRFANPRIYKINGQNYFEFDVQVKASEAGTSFQAGNIAMDFSNSTLSGNNANWLASPGPSFNGKYVTELMINGSVLNLDYKTANSTDLAAITTDYQTMATLSGKITTETGETGIDFSEVNMNGKQFYKLSTNPGYAAYKNINAYDDVDFADTYVGRIYAIKYGWTQIDNLNWNTPENTSVWEGDAIVPVANASNLRIHKPARLTIPTDGELTVNGNTDIQSVNGLIIESDATGTGSLITGTAFGLTTVQRYMTTDAWHIVSSPVSGQSISGFLSSNANIAISEDDSFRGMMDYNPVLNAWNDYFTNATGGSLTTGKGYCLRTNANSAVNFSGFIQAGTQSSTGLISESWNCIGNPYTSALGINNNSSSSSNFLDENVNRFDPSFGAIYVWDEPDESNGQYGKYTVISNASPAFEIQQGQAYLVKMKTGSTSVNFNSGMQLHNPGLALKSTKNVWPIITLEASVNAQKSSTTITFCEGMTKGLDPTYDAGLLKGGSDLIIYSRLVEDNGIPFAIQALPIQNIGNMIIPLGLDSKTGGEVVFSSELVNLPTDCKVILEDKELKTLTDLSLNVYKATIATNSVISDRFLLHVSALTTGTVNEKEGGLGAYAFRNTEMRVIGKVGDRAVASVFDIQGKLILIEKLNAGSINTVKLPLIKTGIYLLVVKDGENIQRFKVPVNEY